MTRARRWLADLAAVPRVGAALDEGRALAVLADLEARHGEPARRYHTIDHVDAVLAALDRLTTEPDDDGDGQPGTAGPDDDGAVALAVWFHDAVYDPRRADNEAASARLATEVLTQLGVAPATVAEVARLVELTAGHQVAPTDRAGARLADADLSVLGSDERSYDRYARQIRAEYAHVPDDDYRVGRSAVLAGFLERDRIYRTPAGRARWEQRARANLEREGRDLAGDTG